mmetsp:Transcript_19077/g.54984  ORF Transcript_19077/g.54984 Transcript_19077/m.54984 type:complete len:316 (+) Transcript_19077:1002-1949(+)
MVAFCYAIDIDSELVTIQMGKIDFESGQCINQWDLHGLVQLISVAVEQIILGFKNDKIQVAGRMSGLFVGHALERDALPGSHSLGNIEGQVDLLGLGLALRTLLAVGSPRLAAGDAPIVALLNLLDEAGGELLHLDADAGSLALLRGLHAFLPVETQDLAHVLNLNGFALVQLFHGHVEGQVDGGGLLLLVATTPATATEVEAKLREDVFERITATTAAALLVLLQSLLAVHVVDLLRLLVTENLVRPGNFGERFGISALVGVVLQRLRPVCLLDLFDGGRSLDAENLVVVLGKGQREEGTELKERVECPRGTSS